MSSLKSPATSQTVDPSLWVGDFLSKLGVQPRELKTLPDDPWKFVTQCCFTFDERALEKGVPEIQQFPPKKHLEIITREWQANTHLCVEKSSQIMVTWLFSALMLYKVLRNPAQRIAWFCLKRPLAIDHLQSRVYRMYQLIPAEYKKPYAHMSNGEFLVFHNGEGTIPTSRITPMAAETDAADQAAKQMRSETWTEAFEDEAAFYRNGGELHFSLLPRCGRYNKVSTPNGDTFFNRLGYAANLDDVSAPMTTPQMELLGKGLWGWKRNGFRHLRVHYSADADRDPETVQGKAWLELEKPRYSTRKWRREQEIDSTVPAGLPVYCDTDKIVAKRQTVNGELKLFCDWDFGFSNPVCIIKQVKPIEDKQGREIGVTVHVLLEIHFPNILIQAFAENYVIPKLKSLFPYHWEMRKEGWIVHYGDPAGHQRSDKSPMTSIQVLQSLGIAVLTSPAMIDTRIDLLQDIISMGRFEIDPAGAPGLLADLRGGYYRDEQGRPVKDGIHDHRPDALGYGIFNLFRLGKGSTGPSCYRPPPSVPAYLKQMDGIRQSSRWEPSRPSQGPPPAKHTRNVYRPAPSNSYRNY